MVKNIDQHRDDAKSLVRQLDEILIAQPPDIDVPWEQDRLDNALQRYQQLMPAVEITNTRSSIVVKSYEYRELVEKRAEWLTDAGERMKDNLTLDDLQSVKVMMEEQGVSTKPAFKSDIKVLINLANFC